MAAVGETNRNYNKGPKLKLALFSALVLAGAAYFISAFSDDITKTGSGIMIAPPAQYPTLAPMNESYNTINQASALDFEGFSIPELEVYYEHFKLGGLKPFEEFFPQQAPAELATTLVQYQDGMTDVVASVRYNPNINIPVLGELVLDPTSSLHKPQQTLPLIDGTNLVITTNQSQAMADDVGGMINSGVSWVFYKDNERTLSPDDVLRMAEVQNNVITAMASTLTNAGVSLGNIGDVEIHGAGSASYGLVKPSGSDIDIALFTDSPESAQVILDIFKTNMTQIIRTLPPGTTIDFTIRNPILEGYGGIYKMGIMTLTRELETEFFSN